MVFPPWDHRVWLFVAHRYLAELPTVKHPVAAPVTSKQSCTPEAWSVVDDLLP